MLGAARKIEEDAGKRARAREAIERDPKSAVAYYHLGILLEEIRGDEAGAETAYRKACDLDPQYADAFINLGNLLKGDGILKGSEGVLQGVVRGRPEEVRAGSLNADLQIRCKLIQRSYVFSLTEYFG